MTELDHATRTHPLSRDLYTPITVDLILFLDECKLAAGTWRAICERGNIRLRVLRRLRHGNNFAVSMSLMDRIITGAGTGSLYEWLWFEADDLVKLGFWEETLYVEGRMRYHGDRVWEAPPMTPLQRELLSRRRYLSKRRRKESKQRREDRKFWERLLN